MRRRSHCALCGDGLKPLFDKDGYAVCRCGSCSLVQVNAALSRDELERIYGEEYFSSEVFHDYVAEREVRVLAGRAAVQTLARLVPAGKLLDVGCAAGFFLEAASAQYEATGVELSPFASSYARDTLGLRVFTGDVSDGALDGERFDVVTAWNTIEHMADPLGAFTMIGRIMPPGGLLAVSTGDVTGPLARFDLRNWNLMVPPYHLFFFSPKTIDLLLARAGFEVRRVVYDGVVAMRGPLASEAGRLTATMAGLGNVMTVYATRTTASRNGSSVARRLAARYRPLRFVRASPDP